MIRKLVIAGAATAMLGFAPAFAQEYELEGAPGYQSQARPPSTQREADQKAADLRKAQAAEAKAKADQAKLAKQAQAQKAEQARLSKDQAAQKAAQAKQTEQAKAAEQARLAETQKSEQARLARQAEELKAQQAKLDARAAELAAEERRLAKLDADLRTQQASAEADLARARAAQDEAERASRRVQTAEAAPEPEAPVFDRDEPGRAEAGRPEAGRPDDGRADPVEPGRDVYRGRPPFSDEARPDEGRRPIERVNYELARRSCMAAAQDEAEDRNFYSARYDSAPHLYRGEELQLRGRMRLEDRRGYLLVDSVCEIDEEGIAQRFAFLR